MKSRMFLMVIALVLFSVGALISIGNSPVLAGKRPGQDRFPVEVVLENKDGDMIRSDGLGTYVDGIDGVGAAFNPATGDLILRMPSDSPRSISFDFTNPFDGYSSYGLSSGLEIVVAGIYSMAGGEERLAVANMNAGIVDGALGAVRFGTLPTETAGNNSSVPLYVKRLGDSWLVSTRVNIPENGVETGDKARLTRSSGSGKKQIKTTSYHHMPFSLIATLKP